jgi:putative PIN family toxin of toxin-antitoxin system
MPRVVLDTNVLVSAVISQGKPRELLRKGITKQFSMVLSDFILREFVRVFRRPRFETSEDEIHKIVLALMQVGEVVTVRSNFKVVKDDPDDDAIVNTALDGRADMIVTGDSHLLRLRSFKGIKIVSVPEALQQLVESE